MSRRIASPAALGAGYGLGRGYRSQWVNEDPYDDIAQAALRKQRVYVVEPVVPERLRTKSELRPYEFTAYGYVRSWWGWKETRVTIFIGEFTELSAAFHEIRNMRVRRIERSNDACMAVSREVKL